MEEASVSEADIDRAMERLNKVNASIGDDAAVLRKELQTIMKTTSVYSVMVNT